MKLPNSPRKKISGLTLGLCLFAGISQVCASILLVTNTADNGDGSLRDAIAMANDGDTIQFDTVLKGRSIMITGFFIEIDSSITINGLGAELLSVVRTDGFGPILYVLPNRAVVVQGLTISANGGGLVTEAALTVNQCVITGCSAGQGGGIDCQGNGAALTLSDSTISFNLVTGGGRGAGIYNESGTATIINSVVDNNNAFNSLAGFGGGIYNGGVMQVTNSLITSNGAANDGGGILNVGTLTITNSTVSNNHAGVQIIGTGTGGGIHNGGTLHIQNSTISDNEVIGSSQSGSGGGVFTSGPLTVTEITNSTISNNSANQSGGGIDNSGMLTISNSSFGGNRANKAGGGIRINKGATVEIRHTLLNAGTPGANISNAGGTLISHGYNLSSDDAGGLLTATGDQINTNPLLGPLLDNGGPTFTHELLEGSPAINSGDPSFTPPPQNDQRGPGFARISDGRIDIGSFEVQLATPTPTPTPTATPTPSTKLLNISTRLRVLTDDNALIGGFIVTGTSPKRVIVRAIGPSLTKFGVPGALQDPILELHGPGGFTTITNNNWRDAQESEIKATGLAPTNNLESAIVAMLPPGAYTAVVRGNNGGIGVGLVEGYDLDSSADGQLANISTRGFVDSGDNVMIGGFILGNGSANAMVLIRAIGPSLSAFGVPDALTDPTLELHNGNGATIAVNDDWRDTQETEIKATGIPPSDDRESAILGTLTPGAYTAIVQGKDNAAGVALVEAYQLDNALPPSPTLTPSPTTTPTPTPTATATATSTPTATATPTATIPPTPTATPITVASFGVLSSSAMVQTGDALMMNAFIISGSSPKRVIVRGLGPSLPVPSPLQDPVIELRAADGTLIRGNDNWRSDQEAEIIASGFPPTNDLEAAIVATLPSGSYTVVLRGVNNGTGRGLSDLHDLDPSPSSLLTAIGTRALVMTNADVLISGMTMQQGGNVLVRALGPSLSNAGILLVLANPTLELRDSNGVLLLANNDWQDNPNQAQMIIVSGLAPTNALESALVVNLPPGIYTAITAGLNNGTGIGYVQFYTLPHSGPVLELTP